MVCPDIDLTMSPGRVAVPLGMFSQVGTRPITLIGRPSSATACMTAMTVPAPLMSYFISSICGPGFSEMPPVSNVMPLPTSTTGRLGLCGALVTQDDEARGLFAAQPSRRAGNPSRAGASGLH